MALPIRSIDDDRVAEAWLEHWADDRPEDAVDERTWVDLDLDRVVATIDRTHTALGQQMLYRRLRSGIPWSETPALEALAARFKTDEALRERVGVQSGGGIGPFQCSLSRRPAASRRLLLGKRSRAKVASWLIGHSGPQQNRVSLCFSEAP